MKIGQLAIKNFLGIRQFNSALGELNLICGLNGSGKSSIENAIRLAVIGQVSRVQLKRDYPMLIHEGQKQAQIQIEGDPDATVLLTAAKTTGVPNPEDAQVVLQLLLNMHMLSSLEPTALRKVLLGIGGVGADDAAILQRLQEQGADMTLVESIRPLLRNFEAAEKEAETRAKEARGEWKGITGETYGDVKAETWSCEAPQYVEVKDQLKELAAAASAARQALADLRSGAKRREQLERDLEAARDKGKAYARAAAKMKTIDADVKACEARIAELKDKAASDGPGKPLGTRACPECGSDLFVLPGPKLMARAEFEAEQAASATADVKLQLAEQRKAVEFLQRAKANTQRDLDEADTAAKQAEVYEKQIEELAGEDADDATAKQQELEKAESAYNAHAEALGNMKSAKLAAANAETTTAKAFRAATAVRSWSKIKALMAPDGIPSQFLSGVLDQLNNRLRTSAGQTGWGQVQIHVDMHITYAGRLLQLCSESERWRTDAQLCEAVAYVSAECFLMFDRVDVLGAEQRGILLGWCDQLVEAGHQVVLFSTLKGPPKAEGVNVVWLERGEIKEIA